MLPTKESAMVKPGLFKGPIVTHILYLFKALNVDVWLFKSKQACLIK